MSEPSEREIEDRAESIEPGSAEALEESRRAIDEAIGAAHHAADEDLTDVEFDAADSGPAGAADEAAAEQADEAAAGQDEAAARRDEAAAETEEAQAQRDEQAAERDEASVVEDEGSRAAAADQADEESR